MSLFHPLPAPVPAPVPTGTNASSVNNAENVPKGVHLDYRLYLVQELCSTTLGHALKTGVLHVSPAQPDLDLVLALLLDVAQVGTAVLMRLLLRVHAGAVGVPGDAS
jgi:hypothetical protein